ncbi:hypothetical protein B0H63DRAFT_452613 [Podospora didyma]|uniref:Uncharacterized protein n=1 Tax=Podospora didyma TaxID=330526 RepID=A0AAE0KF05_9PEZI|nr:hypothetical protein B0H63DRAFT_452613 [Podospora didyma]
MSTQNKNRHDKLYANCFKDLGKGHALFRTVLAKNMSPGTCGYFDHSGAWVKMFQVAEFPEPEPAPPEETTLTQLADAARSAESTARDFASRLFSFGSAPAADTTTTPDPVQAPDANANAEVNVALPTDTAAPLPPSSTLKPLNVEDEGLELESQIDHNDWGMKEAGEVSITLLQAAGGASVPTPTVPLSARFLAKLRKGNRVGAVLVTDGTVSYHQADPVGSFEEWMETNLKSILAGKHGSLVRKRGVWIVTRTYTAKRRAVAVMQTRDQSLTFNVDVEVPHIARVGPSAEWWRETVHKPGWESYSGPEDTDSEDAVLFMSGIYWKPNRVTSGFKKLWEQKTKNVLAAGHPLQPIVVETGVVELPDGSLGPLENIRITPFAVGEVDADDRVPRVECYDYEDAPSDIEGLDGENSDTEESDG